MFSVNSEDSVPESLLRVVNKCAVCNACHRPLATFVHLFLSTLCRTRRRMFTTEHLQSSVTCRDRLILCRIFNDSRHSTAASSFQENIKEALYIKWEF